MPEDSGLFRDKGEKLRAGFPNSSFLGEWGDCVSKTSHREAQIRKVPLLKMAVIFQFFTPRNFVLRGSDRLLNRCIALSLLEDKLAPLPPGLSGTTGNIQNLTDPFSMLFPYF